jgi:hypothetical protein
MSAVVQKVDMFSYVASLVAKTIGLSVQLGAASTGVPGTLLVALQGAEAAWNVLFKIAGIVYSSTGFRDAEQAVSQVLYLRDKVTEFKEKYLSKIQRWVRAIANDPATDTDLVRTPTLDMDALITTGISSSTNAVWTSANHLSKEVVKWRDVMPNALSDQIVRQDTVVSEAFGRLVDVALSAMPLLHPDTRVVGALLRKHRPFSDPMTVNGATIYATAGATSRSIALIAAAGGVTHVGRYGDDHNAYIVISDVGNTDYADGIGFPASMIGQRVTVEFYIPRTGELGNLTGNLNGASTSVAVVAAQTGDTIFFEESAGTSTTGTTAITVDQTSNQVKHRTLVPTANTRMVTTVGAASMWFTFKVFHENDQGSMFLSTDGVMEPVNTPNARVIDCIGGINIRQTLETLNFTNFELVMNMSHAAATAHGDSAIYNMMNLHYANHLRDTNTDVAALNTNIMDPLKSYHFWLGSEDFTGIAKTTRQRLWRVYYPVIIQQLSMLKTDGTISRYLQH